ncbi:MAG TPA: thioredoxin family protein [Spirochaetota bacterium]|nr:thioredoxin family protein [Spirochaetota bacterium]
MALFDDKIRQQLQDILSKMRDEVYLIFFTQEIECPMCRETRLFLEEMSSLNEKLKLETYNFVIDAETAVKHKVDKIPAIVVLDTSRTDHGIKFYGLPGGYEINSFLGAVLEVSGTKDALPSVIMDRIKSIDQDVHIQVFVGLGCPHCPGAVSVAHRLALESGKVWAEMIDTSAFVPLAQKYNVTGVPKIVFNDRFELTGAHPLETFLDVIDRLKNVGAGASID